MRLLLIFALTFALSAQQENCNEMMAKVMNAIGEEGRNQVINSLNENDLEKLTKCLDTECGMAEFLNIKEKILNILKRISHGDKLICNLMKTLLKDGPVTELIKTIGEERTAKIIKALNAKEIGELMNMNNGQNSISEFMSFGEKIIPIIKKANGGKGLPKLISLKGGDADGIITLPYHQSVPGGLHPGMSVYVQGMVPKHTHRFQVDFAHCQHEGANIPLHFSPHFDRNKKIVFNTFQEEKWGKEIRQRMPLRKGEHFEIIFIVTEAGYEILVNRNAFYTYRHRIAPQSVWDVRFEGFAELEALTVMGGPTMENLAIPYHQPVPGGLHPGMSVYVQGKASMHCASFRVDFAYGLHKRAIIPFHYRPYFKRKTVGLNTFNGTKWVKEVFHNMVFQRGQDFEFIFNVNKDGYEVLVNKKPFYNYSHRYPPENVQDISVSVFNAQDILKLKSVIVIGGPMIRNMSAMPKSGYGTPQILPIIAGSAIYYPLVPFTGNIPGGLGADKIITVRGFIPKDAKRFYIDFMAGQDIAMRINPDMEEKTVVCNSFLNGNWGIEESDLPFDPFRPGQFFELSIHCGNHEFKVDANGQPFFNYAHHYDPVEHIRTVEITGDVTLSYIKY